MKEYRFSEDFREYCEELLNKSFTEHELHKVYNGMVDKQEYPFFDCWLIDMLKAGLVTEQAPELNKELRLLDAIEEIRQRSCEHPELYPIDYTIRLITATVASYIGYESRADWTEILKACEDSRYHERYYHTVFHI